MTVKYPFFTPSLSFTKRIIIWSVQCYESLIYHGQYFPPFLRWCTPWQSHRPLVRNPLEASWSGTRSDYHQLIWDKEKLSPLDLGQGVIIIFRGKLDSTMAAKTVGQNNLEQLSFTHNSNQMRSSSLLVENSAEPQWRDSRSKPQNNKNNNNNNLNSQIVDPSPGDSSCVSRDDRNDPPMVVVAEHTRTPSGHEHY